MDKKSKVFIKTDHEGRITAIDGGYSMPIDLTGWILIDAGDGDRYNLCQSHYLPDGLTDERGLYRYKYVDSQIVERTQAEIDADYVSPAEQQSDANRIAELERAFELLLSGVIE